MDRSAESRRFTVAAAGWERVISGNSCPKGLLEDVNEMLVVKKNLEAVKNAHGGKSVDELKEKEAPSISPKTPVVENVKVEKAQGPNAYSIAELYEKGSTLEKQKVVVKGKVVKVSSGIMGKTWVHLRDGSGSAEQETNNLVVTTQDVPDVGDVVTASGTLYKDKDFGGGYKYKVIVEEATITQ